MGAESETLLLQIDVDVFSQKGGFLGVLRVVLKAFDMAVTHERVQNRIFHVSKSGGLIAKTIILIVVCQVERDFEVDGAIGSE